MTAPVLPCLKHFTFFLPMPLFFVFRCFRATAFGLLLAAVFTTSAIAAPPDADEPTPLPMTAAQPLSATAEQIFTKARPRLLQIRTLLTAAQKQSSIGSGFLVDADGFALTNYHVVSQYALEPQTYQLDYLAPDGTRGRLRLHAIDIANDLAVVRLEPSDKGGVQAPRDHFTFNPVAVAGALPKGERLFAMGNPFDLGFTIVEGTYNGLVENSYQPRTHFTGALNPGMSGGPAVTADNRIAGVNVAKQFGGDLVSFLVPAVAAHALLEKARHSEAMSQAGVREAIREQLDAWQNGFFAALQEEGFRAASFGPYQAAESSAPWFNCWARTNSGSSTKLRVLINDASCDTRTALFLAGNMSSGQANMSHTYMKSIDLNVLQFATLVSQRMQPSPMFGPRRRYTPQQCYENFLAPDDAHPNRPVLRVTWCARAYRDFADLYDIAVTAVTQDSSKEALISRLSLTGVSYPNAITFTERFLNTLEVSR
ncbi:MAG: serine protease [Proteobacteria bacterium]|nr:serine protease [Pseudomonadota bacterium]MCL2307519.1 serine protease [Pseudomonadota bacterium]